MFKDKVMGIILAGGAKRRLEEITSDIRAQPAVPFGGKYRIIDFIISSFFNSHIKNIYVLIQHKSLSLLDHINQNWSNRFGSRSEYIRVTGPMPPHWQKGTADSVYKNLSRIKMENPDLVAIFGGDHICNINLEDVLAYHNSKDANLTICAMKYPLKKAAGKFGILKVDKDGYLIGFQEKTKSPEPIPGDEEYTWVSLGDYIFDKELLVDSLEYDAEIPDDKSNHEFGKDVIPSIIEKGAARICVYDISKSENSYWFEMDGLDSYFDVSMKFIEQKEFKIDPNRPVYSINTDNLLPARILGNKEETEIANSIISDGCVLEECEIEKSILFQSVEVGSKSKLKRCILFNDVKIGKNCILEDVIFDKRVIIPDGTVIEKGKITSGEKATKKSCAAIETLKPFVTASGKTVISNHHDYSDIVKEGDCK